MKSLNHSQEVFTFSKILFQNYCRIYNCIVDNIFNLLKEKKDSPKGFFKKSYFEMDFARVFRAAVLSFSANIFLKTPVAIFFYFL